jgi:putative phosphoribosyl transferase
MEIEIPVQVVFLKANLDIPDKASGLVIFSYGSGSSRLILGNVEVAESLKKDGFGILLFDLLTEEEDKIPRKKFDIQLLTERLIGVTKWCMEQENTKGLRVGYFGVGTGAAAALSASAFWGTKIGAVVSRNGRPDLAMEELDLIEAPTLLIVDGQDKEAIEFNRKAFSKIGCAKKMELVEETSEEVMFLSSGWFRKFLI